MNQTADILDLAAQAIQQNIDAVLATVVRTEGSAYRQSGAMARASRYTKQGMILVILTMAILIQLL